MYVCIASYIKTHSSESRGQEKQPVRRLPRVYIHVGIAYKKPENKTNLSTTRILFLLLILTSKRPLVYNPKSSLICAVSSEIWLFQNVLSAFVFFFCFFLATSGRTIMALITITHYLKLLRIVLKFYWPSFSMLAKQIIVFYCSIWCVMSSITNQSTNFNFRNPFNFVIDKNFIITSL